MGKIKIYYDDDADNIITEISKQLESFGLVIEEKPEEEGDDYLILEIKPLK